MTATRNIAYLYAFRFASGLIPAYVIERLYWETRGMTIPMVIYTEIIYAATIVLLEIPTGMLADRWGRRRMIVLAAALASLEFLILVFANAFWHFALVVFLAGVARAASSGAENALLYDSLAAAGEASTFEKRLGRLNAVDIAAIMLAALSGSWMAGRYGFEFNYWVSLASTVAALGFAWRLREPPAAAADEAAPPLREYVTASLRLFRSDRGIFLVTLSGMATGAAIGLVDEFWQLHLDRLQVPVAAFGLFSAAMFLSRLPGHMLSAWLRSRLGYRALLTIAMTGIAVGLAVAAFARGPAGLAAVLLLSVLAGLVEPLAAGYLHPRIGTAMRATMDSFQSLALNALSVAAGLGFGFASAKGDVFGGYGFLAAFVLAIAAYFWLRSRRVVDRN